DGEIEHPQEPDAQKSETDAAENMLRALAVADEKRNGQQIEKPAGEAFKAVLRMTELPRPMLNRQFRHAEAARVSKNRNEAVEFAVETEFLRHFGSKLLKAAVVIVQFQPG